MYVFVKLRSILFFSLAFSLFLPLFSAQAQSINAFKVNVMPAAPGPFEDVTITIEDYSRDLNKVEILWSVNGDVQASGVGLKRFQTKTGATGVVTEVDINIGGDVETVTLRPNTTDLIWQADTYTPPFYKGKALHTAQDPIIVYAEPFILNSAGARLDPAVLVYTWSLDGKVNQGSSGYGQRSFRITPSILPKPVNVSVEIASADRRYVSVASITIPHSTPEIVFYENHPLYGIRANEALNGKDFDIGNAETNVIAEPFFFSNAQKTIGLLTYNWSLNNTAVNQVGNEIIVRKPTGEGSGKSQISLSVKNPEKLMQAASATMYARYNNTSNTTQTVF